MIFRLLQIVQYYLQFKIFVIVVDLSNFVSSIFKKYFEELRYVFFNLDQGPIVKGSKSWLNEMLTTTSAAMLLTCCSHAISAILLHLPTFTHPKVCTHTLRCKMSTNKQVNPYFYTDFELLWCSENYNMAHMLLSVQ